MTTILLGGVGDTVLAAAAPPWVPTDRAGLKTWLRGDVGLYAEPGRFTPALADGALVGGWADSSGSANHWSQATGTKQPTLKTAIRNGRNVVLLDGVDDFMDATVNAINGPTWTLLVVHQTVGDGIILGPTSGNNQVRVGQSGGNVLSMYDGGNNPLSGTLAVARTSWRYDTWQSGPHFYSNGVNYDAGGAIGSLAIGRLGILSDGTTLPTSGYVGEVIIYDSLLSAGDLALMHGYAASGWAI